MVDLASLNEAQREAVTYIHGPLLVSAGAGSGKTRVITYKIAHLLFDIGIDPAGILAVTFTNKAANEMRERVHKLVGTDRLPLTVCTFHSYCARLLRANATRLGYPPSFTIADSSEQERILKRAIEKVKGSALGTPRKLLSMISRIKEDGVLPAEALQKAKTPDAVRIAEIYAAYQKALYEQKTMDFDDLLLQAVVLLRRNPDLLRPLRDGLSYFLIDEYQDTNLLQFELTRLLAPDNGNGLCAVGDEDQSIYGWRGASIDHIRRFEKDFKNAKVILLEENYRSTGHILRGASTLIGRNDNRYEKVLKTAKPLGEAIRHFQGDGVPDEVDFVVRELRKLTADVGATPAAILYRANYMSRAFEDGLVRAGLKYRIVGSLRFYERREIKDLSSYLRLLMNPRDVQAFLRAATVPPRKGLGPKSLDAVVERAASRDIGLLEASIEVAASGVLTAPASNGLRQFVSLVDHLIPGLDRRDPAPTALSRPVAELLRSIVMATAYEQHLKSDETDESAEDRWGNVKELLNAAGEFDSEKRGTLADFLDSISLTSGQDEVSESAPILLMTLHCAKGLEFPSVFLVNLNENSFPLPKTVWNPAELEEERRLCYVGMTRAQKRLYLTSNYVAGPSRFVREMGAASVVSANGSNEREDDDDAMPVRTHHPVARHQSTTAHPRIGIGAADRVTHPTFGRGTVLKIEGGGETATATIAFDRHGVRRMVMAYAKLTKSS